jgi:hypothetical protein
MAPMPIAVKKLIEKRVLFEFVGSFGKIPSKLG